MISEEKIMELVKKYASSKKGKEAIKKKYGVDYVDDPKELMVYGEQMRNIVFQHISPIIRSITISDIVVGQPVLNESGQYELKLSFKEGALHRDSLYEEGYPEGLNNIVLLFAHGYHASSYVYGAWASSSKDSTKRIRSRISREPNNFLQAAVAEFNSSPSIKGVAVATLENEYK